MSIVPQDPNLNPLPEGVSQQGSGRMPHRKGRRPLGIMWATRRDLTGCYVTVNRDGNDKIDVVIPGDHGNFYAHPLGRHEARLFARRINQCLDATVIH